MASFSRRIAFLFPSALLFGTAAFAQSPQRYEVTVTNLTRGQRFTPILVASHRAGPTLFTEGSAATVPLEILAEGGDTGPLAAFLTSDPLVRDVADSGRLLDPGASVTVSVEAGSGFDHVSVVSMLIPTNDGFFALNGVPAPQGVAPLTLYSPAWDAGTESNDELCIHIPGPPCMGEGFSASRAGAEGFVRIHEGIHGIGDAMPAVRDWRNPVAKIVIRPVR